MNIYINDWLGRWLVKQGQGGWVGWVVDWLIDESHHRYRMHPTLVWGVANPGKVARTRLGTLFP